MSASEAKFSMDRVMNKKQSASSAVAEQNQQAHPKKGMFRRLQTEANLLKRGVAQSLTNNSADSVRDFSNNGTRHCNSNVSVNSNSSPNSSSGNSLAIVTKKRSDRNSATEDSIVVSTHGSSQPASPGVGVSKTVELHAKLQRIIEENQPNMEQLNRIASNFQILLKDKCGLELFREFLRIEFCQENIDFWCACENFRNSNGLDQMNLKERAKQLYDEFVCEDACRQVNLDSDTRKQTEAIIMAAYIDTTAFELAQSRIETLMEKDKYQRFLQSGVYRYALDATQKIMMKKATNTASATSSISGDSQMMRRCNAE